MEFEEYVRIPFVVEAVQVTKKNIAEIAEMIGELRTNERGVQFIHVNRRLVPNVFQVYPGFWVTKVGDNIRCYTKKLFAEQFIKNTDDISNWVEFTERRHRRELFEFTTRQDEVLKLDSAVFEALGAASTCWERMDGTGIFQSDRAKEIGERLLDEIYNHAEAHLGLATTEQLLEELKTRIEMDYYEGGGGLEYTTVGGRPSSMIETSVPE